ncbi:hypothetical protein FRC09_017098, partial [Ceratobasidium sp. 395]
MWLCKCVRFSASHGPGPVPKLTIISSRNTDYFIISLDLFGYNELDQVFSFDERLYPYLLDTATQEQPAQSPSYFQVRGVPHRVDSFGCLWFYDTNTSEWYPTVLYASMQEAMGQIGRELLQPQMTIGSEIILMLTTHRHEDLISEPVQTIIQDSDQTTAAHNFVNAYPSVRHENDITNSIADITSGRTLVSHTLPDFSPTPDQEEVETWLVEYRKQRRSSRSQQGLADIVCPLPGGRQVLRRPHPLKDHLFFHFDIR